MTTQTHMEQELSSAMRRRAHVCWWCVVGAVLPFLAIYVAHFSNGSGIPTGFIQGDMPYYNANGREIFERGNGVAYPNPYDPAPNPPVIYFHWLVWIFGFGITKLGIEPGMLFLSIGLVSAFLMSYLTWKLVAEVLPTEKYQRTLFLLSMWGGGMLVIGKLLTNLVTGTGWTTNLLAYDPGEGLWFLNWGRNVIFSTEATYHLLVAATWLTTLRGRYWWSVFFAGLLATTHPWSGLEILGTLSAFWGLRFLFDSRKQALPYCVVLLSMVVLFLGYNLKYLDSFPEHRNLHHVWQLDWSLSMTTILLAWGPVGMMALLRQRMHGHKQSWNEILLWLAFGVAFTLSVHDRFMKPTQPLHFTRGYVWMPLFLLGLPLLQQWISTLIQQRRITLLSVACGLACVDNLTFICVQVDQQSQPSAKYFLSKDEIAIIRWLNEQRETGVVVCSDHDFGYLLATYTSVRTYVGHPFNTPDIKQRRNHIQQFLATGRTDDIQWIEPVDLYVVPMSNAKDFQNDNREILFSSGEINGGGLAVVR